MQAIREIECHRLKRGYPACFIPLDIEYKDLQINFDFISIDFDLNLRNDWKHENFNK